MDWPKEIARMAFVKNALHEADTRKIWPYYLPELGATIDNIVKTEVILDFFHKSFFTQFHIIDSRN
ncbi:hypothetical protein F913_02965 [Acinetobacter baumannii NIPH 80]|uniref:Uncharacterized protein n=1 Tax=Acinetobacter baumannii NIPH 80 TaxID=1217629 RepID=N9KQX3_ACIBA|nr:hypothetical protein F913_02965 [Acinetobacter baumannii NIPH 80]